MIIDEPKKAIPVQQTLLSKKTPSLIFSLIYVICFVAAVGLISFLLPNTLQDTGVALLLILIIMSVAYFWGMIVSLFAAIVSFLYFDFFHLPPIYSLKIHGVERMVTFVVFILTSLVVGQLTSHLKNAYQKANQKQIRTMILYRFIKLIADCTQLDTLLQQGLALIETIYHLPMIVWLAQEEHLSFKISIPAAIQPDNKLIAAAEWSWQNQKNCGSGTEILSNIGWFIMPLQTADATMGIIAIQVNTHDAFFHVEQQHLFQSLIDQLGIGIYKMQLESIREKAKILAETDKLRRALLSSVTHDLRTPLATIIGALSSYLSFEEKMVIPSKKELLISALAEGERLNRYIGNLLTLTKLEANVLQLNNQWTDCIDIINRAIKTLKVPLNNYHLILDIIENLPLIWVDPIMTEQVLINLLDNAMKFSPINTDITISVTSQADYVTIRVIDKGCGLTPEQLQQIFTLFYRADSLNDSTVGSGMGLSICKGILAAEQATIEAQSPGKNRGCMFIIKFYKIQYADVR